MLGGGHEAAELLLADLQAEQKAVSPVPACLAPVPTVPARRTTHPPTRCSYGAEQGTPALREAICHRLYSKVGRKANEIFVSDGSKCDIGRLQLMFGADVTVALQVRDLSCAWRLAGWLFAAGQRCACMPAGGQRASQCPPPCARPPFLPPTPLQPHPLLRRTPPTPCTLIPASSWA